MLASFVGVSYLQSRCYITSANPNMRSIKMLSFFYLRFVSHLITLFRVSNFNLTMTNLKIKDEVKTGKHLYISRESYHLAFVSHNLYL